ncbi:tetratricopeptide repeat protein [Xanthomonas rydalmerensis]|uniref:Tetratricopeptide repeat protein n=1 Tax=Xanthomonas rydalmerensis TaxID=3046274 RepID=A0ABZ0JKZ9_9XANT|nr:tetratricopeptide repeat protein [Xanthomonas sp. DM-2023]WOS40063.1 tetratricopeptide repeat protein [Xanthomonas sp. DM-2023]WOS44247.1 tetratricopeptide repeat protein [Xanthomonas sp. DM-2023]WOS48427.1 tetratricopeptide repeat protein [Xanthomonas sp. DM-2023]WOS52607.1 tetratricopeptide repeat protein [Xanthomonas sp. DM-2023]WOS56791.1 tetratricopeptide repeat protein [Xanthomonas sp. DM-2023]
MPALIRIRTFLLLSAIAAVAAPAAAKAPSPAQDVMTPVLAGEFALQAGQLADASRWYLQAANDSPGDAGLAERATRIAMLANDSAAATQALALWRQRAPESLAMRSSEASLALRNGNLRQARSLLVALLRDKDPRGWRFALIALVSGNRDPEVAAKALDQLLDANAIPDQLEAWQEFGRLALRLDQPKLAERIVDQLVKRFPQEPRVALLHATQLQQAGKTEQARALLEGVEPKVSGDPELRTALAYAYDAIGDTAAAARVLALGPQTTQNYGLRASMLAKLQDNAALTALYDELRKGADRPDPERRLLLGKIAEFLKRNQEAVDWYRGVPGGPLRSEARLRAAGALYALGQKDAAFAEARALQDDAEADDAARRDAYVLEAELRQRSGDDAGELQVFERGLAAYPDDNALLYARGLSWERRDRIDRAEADLRKILVTDPENVAALNALGYTLADRTKRYREALQLIDRARTADPDNAAIIDSYGWVLYRLGKTQEALVQLRRAWSQVKDPEIAAHIGQVLWEQGKHEEANKYFDEARKLDPDNRALRRALEQVSP